MVYPVSRNSFRRPQRSRRARWPWILALVLVVLALLVFVFLFLQQSFHHSAVMKAQIVDFLFLLEDNSEVVLIRNNLQQRINYVVPIPSSSYEPIRGVSLDYEDPKQVYATVESFFGKPDLSFQASLDREGFAQLKELLDQQSAEVQDAAFSAEGLVTVLRGLPLGLLEPLFFPTVRKALPQLLQSSFSERAFYRLVDQLAHYAIKTIPVSFMTRHPIQITVRSGMETQTLQRWYIDEKSLKTIKEFMEN
ncbi:MAG TPA: hypothetical protein P5560_02390 [Thermotogota bacterium]|nr:hypothetical protein [Thermotogota bacterium]